MLATNTTTAPKRAALPEVTKSRTRKAVSANPAPIMVTTTDRHSEKLKAASIRLSELEVPIANSKIMTSILATLAAKFAQDVIAYKDCPGSITASRMAGEIEDEVEQILYLSYQVEDMLRALNLDYLAPLTATDHT